MVPTPNAANPTLVEVNISGFPVTPYYLKGAMTIKPVRVIRRAEGLGATN